MFSLERQERRLRGLRSFSRPPGQWFLWFLRSIHCTLYWLISGADSFCTWGELISPTRFSFQKGSRWMGCREKRVGLRKLKWGVRDAWPRILWPDIFCPMEPTAATGTTTVQTLPPLPGCPPGLGFAVFMALWHVVKLIFIHLSHSLLLYKSV